MPKPQQFRRIIAEDFPEKERPTINKLAYSINSFAEDVLQCLNNNLSMQDNLAANQKTFSVMLVSGVPTIATSVKTGLNTQCGGIQVIRAVNKTTITNFPTSAPFISFTNDNGLILINKITGLQDNEKYDLTVIFWPA